MEELTWKTLPSTVYKVSKVMFWVTLLLWLIWTPLALPSLALWLLMIVSLLVGKIIDTLTGYNLF